MLFQQSRPIGVHPQVDRFVVKHLRCPLDGVDLGDFRGNHQTRDFEELVSSYVLVSNCFLRTGRIPQAGVCLRIRRASATKLLNEQIMLTSKYVVKKTQTDIPIVRKCHGLLTRPLWVLRIGWLKYRQVWFSGARAGLEQKFCRIVTVALDAPR